MIAEAKYLIQASNKRLMTCVLVAALIIGMSPIGRTQADEMGITLAQTTYTDGAGGQQGIDVYQPGQGGNHPGIIFVHGGGWRAGDKGQYAHLGNVAANRGFTAFSIDYRLGPSGTYYQYEDVRRAVEDIRSKAAQYGTDPNRIAIWGDSAGGSLAMRVAASGETGLAAAVGWSAPVNAYTAIFNSIESFAIGLNHSTCVPFDPVNIMKMIPTSTGGENSSTTGTPANEQAILSMLQGNAPSASSGTNSSTDAIANDNTTTDTTTGATPGGTTNSLNQIVSSLLGSSSQSQSGESTDINSLVNMGIQALTSAAGASGDPRLSNAANLVGDLGKSTENNMTTPSIYDPKSPTASEAVKTAAAGSPLAATASHTAASPMPAEAQRAVLAIMDMMGCQDNFRVLSPALNFSKNTPPTFLVNAQDEFLVHPGQAIEYSNNLREAGIDSEFLILPGANHMGYDERAVEPTFEFLAKRLNP